MASDDMAGDDMTGRELAEREPADHDTAAPPRPKLAVWKFASCDGFQLTLLNC